MADSSTSASDLDVSMAGVVPAILLRLMVFMAPVALAAAVLGVVLVRTGELLPPPAVAWLQAQGKPFLYLTSLSDRTFDLKISAVSQSRPDIVVMGSSRSNQWRSAMFNGRSFYNGGNGFYAIDNFIEALNAWSPHLPKTIILTLDYFLFVDRFNDLFKSKTHKFGYSTQEAALIVRQVFERVWAEPGILLQSPKDPLYQVPALGFGARDWATGARIDGSYQYGHIMLGYGKASVEQAMALLALGDWPLFGGEVMATALRQRFEHLARIARERGVHLVAVTPPYDPKLLAAMRESPLHGAFRQFHSQPTADWLASLGVIYFDFSELASIDGEVAEFVDPFHPTEPAYVRMLLKMNQSPAFRKALPFIDEPMLKRRLATASQFEVFRNEF